MHELCTDAEEDNNVSIQLKEGTGWTGTKKQKKSKPNKQKKVLYLLLYFKSLGPW